MENQDRKKVTQTVYERLAQVYGNEKAYYLARALDDIQSGKIKDDLKLKFFGTIEYGNIVLDEEHYIMWFNECKRDRKKRTLSKEVKETRTLSKIEKLMQATGLTKEAVIEWLKAFNNTDMVE